jgi:hypothetical protein
VDELGRVARSATVGDVLGDPPGVGYDRQCGGLAGPGGEWAAVHDKEVVDLVRLAPPVDDRGGGVVCHSGGAVLVGAVPGDLVDVDPVDLVGAHG